MLNLEQQIFHQLERSHSILIVFSGDGDNDAMASALALFLFLKQLKKEVDIVGPTTSGDRQLLSFLPSFSEIKDNLNNLRRFIVSLNIGQAKINQIKYTIDQEQLNFIISPADGWFKPEDVSSRAGEFKYDLIFVLGTADLESIGKIYDANIEFFYKTTIVNIDHHSANEEFGQINFLDLSAVATSEILFYLLKNYRSDLITEDIATSLLAGIIQQTKNFKTANLTPRTLLTTSELIALGARREEIVDHLYRSRSISSLKLWGRLLNNLESTSDNHLLWSKLTAADLKETGATSREIADIVDELIATVPSAQAIIVFCEEATDKTTVMVFSLKNLNALSLLREYGSKGTVKIAQTTLNQGLKTATGEIINKIKAQLDKLV